MAERRALLMRLERLRAAERQDALALLAARRTEQARMEEVARRSRALAGAGVLEGDINTAAALTATLAFHARLAGLVVQAERLGAAAGQAAAAARIDFAAADQRLGRVRERRDLADRQAEAQKMARSLLCTGQTPRRTV